MSQVAIYKCKNPETTMLLEHVEAITDSIQKRAFNIFRNRNGENGSDLDDWLQAERDVVWSPASELVDDKKEFRARIALPGFDAKDIQVSAMPDALVIQADATHTVDKGILQVTAPKATTNDGWRIAGQTNRQRKKSDDHGKGK